MTQWYRFVQDSITEIDRCIRQKQDERMTLEKIAGQAGYSVFWFSRKFREIAGISFRDYLRFRRLAFAVQEIRDTDKSLLDIAVDYGFSSHEAFTHAFRKAYGITPSQYRKNPCPLVLRTLLRPFDCYMIGKEHTDMTEIANTVKTYFITLPAHKFLHIRNLESIGYFDFWEKQSHIPGQDCETICGLLDSIPDKLDDMGTGDLSSGSGQLMAWQNDAAGRICSWGIPLAECYGVRLPVDYDGPVPEQMLLVDVPEGEYIVFEHGPFDYETQAAAVEAKIEQAMKDFDYNASGYQLDTAPGRFFYYYHNPAHAFKYVRPVRRG